MAPDEAGICTTADEAATLGHLSALLPLHVLSCKLSRVGQVIGLGGCEGPEILQLVANQLSVLQWARTLSRVRNGLHATSMSLPGASSLWQPCWVQHQRTHAVLCLQTSRALHAVLPQTFALYVDCKNGQVPSCV